MLPLKLIDSLSDQVAQLVRTVEMNGRALAIVRGSHEDAHKEIQSLRSQNLSLARQLANCTSSTL